MIEVQTNRKQELAEELQERVKSFFITNGESPDNFSVEMKLTESSDQTGDLTTIHVLVKDACSGAVLMTI